MQVFDAVTSCDKFALTNGTYPKCRHSSCWISESFTSPQVSASRVHLDFSFKSIHNHELFSLAINKTLHQLLTSLLDCLFFFQSLINRISSHFITLFMRMFSLLFNESISHLVDSFYRHLVHRVIRSQSANPKRLTIPRYFIWYSFIPRIIRSLSLSPYQNISTSSVITGSTFVYFSVANPSVGWNLP